MENFMKQKQSKHKILFDNNEDIFFLTMKMKVTILCQLVKHKQNTKKKYEVKTRYFLVCNKKSRFDFADELKIGDVRYKHLTQITIKVQLF